MNVRIGFDLSNVRTRPAHTSLREEDTFMTTAGHMVPYKVGNCRRRMGFGRKGRVKNGCHPM